MPLFFSLSSTHSPHSLWDSKRQIPNFYSVWRGKKRRRAFVCSRNGIQQIKNMVSLRLVNRIFVCILFFFSRSNTSVDPFSRYTYILLFFLWLKSIFFAGSLRALSFVSWQGESILTTIYLCDKFITLKVLFRLLLHVRTKWKSQIEIYVD